jgi:hypothetical protein
MLSSRKYRQIVISFIYVVLFSLFSAFVYYVFLKAPETCLDGKQNQDESGIDCGGVCGACPDLITGQDLEVKEVAFVPGGGNRYDVLAKIHNPNDEAGASSFAYSFVLKDVSGKIIATRSGTDYVLPQESKYIIGLNLDVDTLSAASVNLEIRDVTWERFSGYQEKPQVNVYQKSYAQISSGGAGFGEAKGLVSNESTYDFRSLVVKVILRDASGKPLAVNSTEMRTVGAHEQRDFRLIWPNAFPGTVERVDMEVDADVYHSDNFIKQYLPGGSAYQSPVTPAAY